MRPWCWNKYAFFFITATCLVIKDAPSWATVNDLDSSLTNTYDSIMTHILLFGKALDASANALILNAVMNYIISMNRFEEIVFLLCCIFLLYVYLFNFFLYPYKFFETIHSYLFIYQLSFIIYEHYFFTISFCLYPGVSWKFKAHSDIHIGTIFK